LPFRVCSRGVELALDARPLMRALRGERIRAVELEIHFDNGSIKHIQGDAVPMRDSRGAISGAVAAFADVTDIRRAGTIIGESEARFRLLADSAPVMMWQSGLNARCDYFNRCWLEFAGHTLDQAIAGGWPAGIQVDERDGCLRAFMSTFERREPFELQYHRCRADGSFRLVRDRGSPR